MVATWPGRWRRVHASDTPPGLGAREGPRPPREQGRRLGALLSMQASALGEQFVEGRDIGLGTGHQRVRIGRACRDRPAALDGFVLEPHRNLRLRIRTLGDGVYLV